MRFLHVPIFWGKSWGFGSQGANSAITQKNYGSNKLVIEYLSDLDDNGYPNLIKKGYSHWLIILYIVVLYIIIMIY